MISKKAFLARQKGAVLVLVALSLLALLGVAALAVDLSHAYVNKTRLQNLADSLALSAAISLNKKDSGKLPCTSSTTSYSDLEQYAEMYATTCTLPKFTAASGNSEVNTASATADLLFTFTFNTALSTNATNWKTASAINDAKFVRVEATNPMNIQTWFAQIIGSNDVAVSTSAVAGFSPTIPCEVAPVLVCADTSEPNYSDCSDDACYGYKLNYTYCLRAGTDPHPDPATCPALPYTYGSQAPGNFSLLDVGTGAKDIKACMADSGIAANCSAAACEGFKTTGATLPAESGVIAAIAPAFNTRFDIFKNGDSYDGGGSAPQYNGTYSPDKIVGNTSNSTVATNSTRSDGNTFAHNPSPNLVAIQTLGSESITPSNLYKNYYEPIYNQVNNLSGTTAGDATPGHAPETDITKSRRVIALSFVKCTGVKGPVEVVGFGCFFATQPMQQPGNKAFLYGEFIGNGCIALGKTTSSGNFGFYKVVLYKDPLGGHS